MFCDRGGCADVHKDGWGLCLYQNRDRGVRSFYDTTACCHSAMARFVQDSTFSTNNLRTSNLLAHIRYATHGDVRVENLHPFVRYVSACMYMPEVRIFRITSNHCSSFVSN